MEIVQQRKPSYCAVLGTLLLAFGGVLIICSIVGFAKLNGFTQTLREYGFKQSAKMALDFADYSGLVELLSDQSRLVVLFMRYWESILYIGICVGVLGYQFYLANSNTRSRNMVILLFVAAVVFGVLAILSANITRHYAEQCARRGITLAMYQLLGGEIKGFEGAMVAKAGLFVRCAISFAALGLLAALGLIRRIRDALESKAPNKYVAPALSIFVSVLCLLPLFLQEPVKNVPRGGDTANWVFEREGYRYSLDESDNATIVGLSKDKTDDVEITIPEYINKHRVIAIGNSAFEDNTAIETVVMQQGIQRIGDKSFRSCERLKKVVLPDGLLKIGFAAFSYCKGLKNITIPDSVTNIGDSAFNMCVSLESVELPDSLTQIEESVFAYSDIKSIVIPDGVTKIGRRAFHECFYLESVSIPQSVKEIGVEAFRRCNYLKYVSLPDGLKIIAESLFYDCESLDRITIPDGVTSIGDYAFCNCALIDIVIPEGVTSIGNGAFNACYSLKNVTMPNSVTSIGNYAFFRCWGLKYLRLPPSVTYIGRDNPFDRQTLIVKKGSYAEEFVKKEKENYIYSAD